MVVEEQLHVGPLPTADDLLRYDEVLPGSAERIVAMAEKQQAHRFDLESHTVKGQMKLAFEGQRLAFAVVLAVLGVSTWWVLEGYEGAGAFLASVDLVSLAGVFVYGRHQQRAERQERLRRP